MATKWGCVGVGLISHDFCTAVKDNLLSEEHQFIAVAARDIARAKAFAEQFGFKTAYGSYDELANDKDVDVVYVGTIHFSHAEICIKLMNAGKHVLCEKPMTLNLKQTREVLETARLNDVFFTEGMWSRFFPVYKQIRKDLDASILGTIKLVRAEFCVPFSQTKRFQKLELGGGGCVEIANYLFGLATMIYGEMPVSIKSKGNLMPTGVDESGCILLGYKNGAMASLIYHTSLPQAENTAVIYGDKGMIKIEAPFYCPTKMTTPFGFFEFPLRGQSAEKYNFLNTAGLQYEAAAVRNYIKSGAKETIEVPHHHSEIVSAITDEVRRQLGVIYSCD